MALHDLLDRIIINQSEQLDAYKRIFKHEIYLREWFDERPDWRLLKGQGFYRLERLPSQVLLERGLPRLKRPIDYACLCWALWYAERRSVQSIGWFVISELAEEIIMISKGNFKIEDRTHREALVSAMSLLVDLNILCYNSGDAVQWVLGVQSEEADILYEFVPDAPRLLANFDPKSISIVSTTGGDSKLLPYTGETTSPMSRAWRSLLLGPAFWKADDSEAFDFLCSNISKVQQELEQLLGWQLEISEAYARIQRYSTAQRASSLLIDVVPEPGEIDRSRVIKYIYHPVLLLMSEIRLLVESNRLKVLKDGSVQVDEGYLMDILAQLYRNYRRNWGVEMGEQLSLKELCKNIFSQMRRIGYLRGPNEHGSCYLLPVSAEIIGHYNVMEIVQKKNDNSIMQASLFEME
ncbi:TIGR02678 family protein [Paenibacillus sp. NPDC058174]|uniref:TIGR02678 family protein n=1 Tax=Paenibacillus sp. NPDC058174 TaxID=3346366 RepID=UPI0036DE147C